MAAAIAAARAGVDTTLVESREQVGGTVAHALIHTLGGLFDLDGSLVNQGLPAELIDRLEDADSRVARRRIGRLWVLNVAPETYQRVAEEWLRATPRLKVLTGARIDSVDTQHHRVESVSIRTASESQTTGVRSLIDATGGAHLVDMVAPELVNRDEQAAAGLVVRLNSVTPGALDFPKGVGIVRSIRAAVEKGELPAEFGHTWLDRGVDADEVYVKLFLPDRDAQSSSGFQSLTDRIFEFLRTNSEFADSRVDCIGAIGVRDGGRILGESTLAVDELREGEFSLGGSDIACYGSWPIEYWHPEQGVQMQTLPRPVYPIPLDALKVRGWDNLWAVGKCLSADPMAQSSARVVGTCWAMGEAAGKTAAGLHIEEDACEPR